VEEQSRIKERWDEKERVNGVRLKGETEIMAGRASLRQPSEKKGQREKKKQTPHKTQGKGVDIVLSLRVRRRWCAGTQGPKTTGGTAEFPNRCLHTTDPDSQGMQALCATSG